VTNCPNCNSNKLIFQRRGLNPVNGYVASKVFGGLGWLAANVGADNIIASCQDCESQFEYTPSDPQEPSVVFQILQGIAQWVVLMVTIAIVAGGLKCIFFVIDLFR
jgi:hypothetical protein